MTTRMLVAWCPDWPVVATGFPTDEPVAVLSANRIVACSQAARDSGVKRGIRKREAQARCPHIILQQRNPSEESVAFEPVMAAVEEIAVKVEVIRPGICAFATRGPSRYFGGDEKLRDRVASAIKQVGFDCRIGIADGLFAATCAARRDLVIVPDGSAAFLAPLPISTIEQPQLSDLLLRMGLRTLGDFAALPASDVLARFGNEGANAHRLANGLDDHMSVGREVTEEFSVEIEVDPPAQQVDRASFAAKSAADQLIERLSAKALACRLVCIEVETEHGETHRRRWRDDIGFGASAISDRVRWQLTGWLSSTGVAKRPSAGVSHVRLIAEEVVPANGRQDEFWGGESDADTRALRAIDRVRGLIGADGVYQAVLCGARNVAEQFKLIPWGEKVEINNAMPWPGRIPSPAPATLLNPPLPASVIGDGDESVIVNRRGVMRFAPLQFSLNGGEWQAIDAWAGPWLFDERWWDAVVARRRACFQFATTEGSAVLAVFENGKWYVEAVYD